MTIYKDVEKGDPTNSDVFKLTSVRTPYQLYVTPFDEIYVYRYRGEGTLEKPYLVDWLPNDPENPQNWNQTYKWLLTIFVAIATLAVTFCSSAYVGDFQGLSQDFGASTEVITLGISFFVLGFAVGEFFFLIFCVQTFDICCRSSYLGSFLGSARQTHSLHNYLFSFDSFQCWSGRISKYLDSPHSSFLCRCFWLFTSHQCKSFTRQVSPILN
jgi:hypothetical protein